VQDVAAQLVGRLCGATPGERILDACAGVGGKSTHLAQLAGGSVHIDAADLSQRKLDLGVDAARRLGLADRIHPVLADLTAPPPGALADHYDRILLDAPCSGLGTLRRHPEGKWRRRPAELPALAALQARLLDSLASRVRPGGVLVYSVCTFTIEEGPMQIDRFLKAHPEFTSDRGLTTWPHREDCDAFFAARLLRSMMR
jgi:16S rRNA (cytosine967-C5)-methyltransferase